MAVLWKKEETRSEPEALDSCKMKAALVRHYRFKRQAIACTEFDYCDVLAIFPKTKKVVEVEVKISIADLKADFKKEHRIDLMAMEDGKVERSVINRVGKTVSRRLWPVQIDNLFYALPEELVEKATPIIKKHAPYAGIIKVCKPYVNRNGTESPSQVWIEKKAKKLKSKDKGLDFNKFFMEVSKRMSSEIAILLTKKAGW